MTGGPQGSPARTEHAMPLQDVAPGLRLLKTYRRHWLSKDVIAGVVLTTLLVPQGMAYAELAGLPPITGLYTTITCLLPDRR
jgi:MFS superfamily sulfate permease-like transporter